LIIDLANIAMKNNSIPNSPESVGSKSSDCNIVLSLDTSLDQKSSVVRDCSPLTNPMSNSKRTDQKITHKSIDTTANTVTVLPTEISASIDVSTNTQIPSPSPSACLKKIRTTNSLKQAPVKRKFLHRQSSADIVQHELHHRPICSKMISMLEYSASNVIKVHEDAKPASEHIPALEDFIKYIISRSAIRAPVVFLATLYVDRVRKCLPKESRGLYCTRHRVTLAAIIVAYKYLNDINIKNRIWSQIARVFSLQEVNLMERQFLHILNYDLGFSEKEIETYMKKVDDIPTTELENVRSAYDMKQSKIQAIRKYSPSSGSSEVDESKIFTLPSPRDIHTHRSKGSCSNIPLFRTRSSSHVVSLDRDIKLRHSRSNHGKLFRRKSLLSLNTNESLISLNSSLNTSYSRDVASPPPTLTNEFSSFSLGDINVSETEQK
jgi:hypothetical protein